MTLWNVIGVRKSLIIEATDTEVEADTEAEAIEKGRAEIEAEFTGDDWRPQDREEVGTSSFYAVADRPAMPGMVALGMMVEGK